MMHAVFLRYGISFDLPVAQKLKLLETQKQKLLRKLNHVFGNPEKEEQLNLELQQLEAVMEQLSCESSALSLDDVHIETRELSQTEIGMEQGDTGQQIADLERALLEDSFDSPSARELALMQVVSYYLDNLDFLRLEHWLLFGAKAGDAWYMRQLANFYKDEVFQSVDFQKSFYWMKCAAQAGDKESCMELGDHFLRRGTSQYSPQQAATWFVKAADRNHPLAYLKAFTAFYLLGDYKKAETCLRVGYQIGASGTAYRLGLIYDIQNNPTGRRDAQQAMFWFEKAYQHEPDGDVCLALGNLYIEFGNISKGTALFRRGVIEFNSEDCRAKLEDLDIYL